MWRVGTGFSTSLDGFIAGPNDDVSEVFRWYAHGDTDLRFPGGRVSVRVSRASADLLQEMVEATGALVVGQRHFDGAHGWGGHHPTDHPVFVMSHRPPPDWLPGTRPSRSSLRAWSGPSTSPGRSRETGMSAWAARTWRSRWA